MKTKFKVNIELGGKHIRLMEEIGESTIRYSYSKELEYLESKGLVFAELAQYPDNDIFRVQLTRLGKNILAEVQSSEWKMQPGFVVTEKHIDALKHMLNAEYMSVSTAKILGFSEVMPDMTGVNAPFPFLCHAGVAGGWVIIRHEDDTYPNYLEEAKTQVRIYESARAVKHALAALDEEIEG